MTNSHPLSSTAQALLMAAAETANYIVVVPDRLPIAAQRAVVQSMLKAGFIEEVPAEADEPAWRTLESGKRFALRATQAGLVAVGAVTAPTAREGPAQATQGGYDPNGGLDRPTPPETDAAGQTPPAAPVRLRAAAEAVVTALNGSTDVSPALAAALEVLRAALAGTGRSARTETGTPRPPRAGTKQQAVLTLLRRPEGATIAQVSDATGWQQHTVRGFFAGLKKKGITVGVLERVRQVGSGKAGRQGQLHRLPRRGGG